MRITRPNLPGRPRARRAVVAVLATAVASSGAVLATAPAQAATLYPTNYAISMHGYATRATSSQAALQSAATAYSGSSCSKYVGIHNSNKIVSVNAGNQVRTGSVFTNQDSYHLSNGDALGRSTTRVSSVTIGDNTLGFKITGLKGVSETRGTTRGVLSATNTFTFSDLSPLGSTQLPYPLNQPADIILKQLIKGPVTIPHLGVVSMGGSDATHTKYSALAWTIGLHIKLFGQDQAAGGGDDSDLYLARSWSQMTRTAPYGVFLGSAWGVDGTAANGVVSLGKNIYTPMACQGTGGVIKSYSLADQGDFTGQNQISMHNMRNRIYGKQGVPTRGLTGWTENTMSSFDLGGGQLHVTGIKALAKIVRYANGTYHPMYAQSIGSMTVNGTAHAVPKPGQSFEIPNVAKVEVPTPTRTRNKSTVTALRITLLGGTEANTVINLGHAEVWARYR